MSFHLFDLVPAVYRLRDGQLAQAMQLLTAAEQAQLSLLENTSTPLTPDEQALLNELTAKASRGPLESLLMVIDEQLDAFAVDLDQLYDDQFIETCAPWVIPYIGDLIGYQSIQGIAPSVDNPRAEVANTIGLRRRKGTILVIEELARDVTGWGAHALEFFRILADTQYVKHVRLWNDYAPDVRSWQPRTFRNSGFSTITRKVDVRTMATPCMPHPNTQNIGIYLWSLGAYGVTKGDPTPCATNVAGSASCYRFSSLGIDQALFHRAIPQGDPIAVAATEENVPDRLLRTVLCADMQKGVGTSYYGEGASLALYFKDQILNPYQIQIANLAGADGAWNNTPTSATPYAALIDPELGRIALPPPPVGNNPPVLSASWQYGFNAEMGGGEYERAAGFIVIDDAAIFSYPDTASIPRYTSLQAALTFVIGELATHPQVALEFADSGTYSVSGGPISVDLPVGTTLELRAHDETRATVLLDSELSLTGDKNSNFILNGLLVAAGSGMKPATSSALLHSPATRPDGSVNHLESVTLTHCTLVPGWAVQMDAQQKIAPVHPDAPAIVAEPSGLTIIARNAILGAIRASGFVTVSLADSILDSTCSANTAYSALDGVSGGGSLTMTGCTAVGFVHAKELTLVSDSIVWALLGLNIAGSVTTGVFVPGEQVIQSTSVASATLRNVPAGSDWMSVSPVSGTPDASHTWVGQTSGAVFTPTSEPIGDLSKIPGAVTSGIFKAGEQVTQSNTNAVANLVGAVAPAGPMVVDEIVGTANATDSWFGETSGAVFTPSAATAADYTYTAGLIADRLQVGCVRFSYLPIHAITPRRFKCVDETLAGSQPLFFTTQYGHPAYCKQLACTDDTIRRGAHDGGEMGAFHFVLAPLRESDLTIRLQEYLPVGLSAGVIYQT